jgi:pantoate--beta-alanine ligase
MSGMERGTDSGAGPAVARTVDELRAHLARWRAAGEQVALVPTMGALHAGHVALVEAARTHAGRVVVSIFVNPAQFAPHEDFARYPRDIARDRAVLTAGPPADLIYAPELAAIYPQGFATSVTLAGPALGLESDVRPHFFSGVATVLTKLFLQCRPDFTLFGEKDYQQLLVVRQLVRDLEFELEVVGVPTLREADGLALSSRNAYLTPESRVVAGALNRALIHAAARARSGVSLPQAEAEGAAILMNAGFERVDYVALRDAATLASLAKLDRPARVLAAARVGGVRLIDNRAV